MKTIQPFHYIGNKARSIELIRDNLPEGQPNSFVDVFGGSGVVGLTIGKEFECPVIYNDTCTPIKDLMHSFVNLFGKTNSVDVIATLKILDENYPSTRQGYDSLKQAYNSMIMMPEVMRPPHTAEMLLLLLTTRAFNNGVRFNKKGGFNYTFGDRNYLDLDKISEVYADLADIPHIEIHGLDFEELLSNHTVEGDYVFIDSPYIGTDATYNQTWTQKDDERLYECMTNLTNRGINWMMTNVLENRGKTNHNLVNYIKANPKLRQVDTGVDYSNSAHRKSSKKSHEIILMNY